MTAGAAGDATRSPPPTRRETLPYTSRITTCTTPGAAGPEINAPSCLLPGPTPADPGSPPPPAAGLSTVRWLPPAPAFPHPPLPHLPSSDPSSSSGHSRAGYQLPRNQSPQQHKPRCSATALHKVTSVARLAAVPVRAVAAPLVTRWSPGGGTTPRVWCPTRSGCRPPCSDEHDECARSDPAATRPSPPCSEGDQCLPLRLTLHLAYPRPPMHVRTAFRAHIPASRNVQPLPVLPSITYNLGPDQ